MYVYTYICVYTYCMYIDMYICMYICIYIYIDAYVYKYIYIYMIYAIHYTYLRWHTNASSYCVEHLIKLKGQVEEECIVQLGQFVFVHFCMLKPSNFSITQCLQSPNFAVWQMNHPFVLPNPGEKTSVEAGAVNHRNVM